MPKKSTTGRGRGRPEHAPTPALRRRVSIAAGGGILHEHIALALGISRETLRKYYLEELTVGATLRRMEVLQAQYQAAIKKGSTTAAKAYLAAQPEIEAPPLPEGEREEAAPAAEPAAQPGAPVGKKEQAKIDAVTAARGTDWEGLLPKPGTPLQ